MSERVDRTRTKILEAAAAMLREKGYADLSTRAVATEAGVPLSQIHYHFGSKQGLVVALFEYMNGRLLDRQHSLFDDPGLTLSEQWDRACDYFEEDLASGYVRILQELMAAGWSDPKVAAVVREGSDGWTKLLNRVVKKAVARFGGIGPFEPEEITALIGCAFFGAETRILLGISERDLPVRGALRRIGDAIRLMENRPE